jgi:hypothetical protein
MSNGAKLSMAGRTFTNAGSITLDAASTITAAWIDNANGTITIDASAITAQQLKESENGIPVLIVPTMNKGGTWAVSHPRISGCRAKWVDNGDNTSTLYLCRSHGTRIIIR